MTEIGGPSSTAALATASTPTKEHSINHEDGKRAMKRAEVETIASKMLATEANKAGSKERHARTDGEKAMLLFDQLSQGVDPKGETAPFIGGNPLVLGEFGVTISDGTDSGRDRDFGEGEASVAGITSLEVIDGETYYMCPLKDTDSNKLFFVNEGGEEKLVDVPVADGQTEEEAFAAIVADQAADGFIPLEAPILVAEVAEAQLIAESATIQDALDDANKKVLGTFVDSLPQNDPKNEYQFPADIDASLEKSAQAMGLPTADVIKMALNRTFPEDMPAEATLLLSKLASEGKVLLDKSDFTDAMKLLGVDRSTIDTKINGLLEQRTAAAARLSKLQEQNVSQDVLARINEEIADLDAQMSAMVGIDKMWKQAEADGNSPMETYYDKVMDGELAPEIAKGVMEGLQTGDLDKIIGTLSALMPGLPDISGFNGEQREKMMSAFKKGAIGLGIGALIAAIVAAAVVVVPVAVLGQSMNRS